VQQLPSERRAGSDDDIDGYDDGKDGMILLVRLDDHHLDAESGSPGARVTSSFTLLDNGVLRASIDNGTGATVTDSADEWLDIAPATPQQCGAFEVRATALYGGLQGSGVFTGTLDTWEALDMDRTWSLSTTEPGATIALHLEIRDSATRLVRETATVYLSGYVNPGGA
jgi:hypothetical protein